MYVCTNIRVVDVCGCIVRQRDQWGAVNIICVDIEIYSGSQAQIYHGGNRDPVKWQDVSNVILICRSRAARQRDRVIVPSGINT